MLHESKCNRCHGNPVIHISTYPAYDYNPHHSQNFVIIFLVSNTTQPEDFIRIHPQLFSYPANRQTHGCMTNQPDYITSYLVGGKELQYTCSKVYKKR